jgi:hypothetical protein
MTCKSKKSSPVTRHGGDWGERRYSSYSFTTSAQYRGEWSASRPGRVLPPGKGPPVPIGQEAGGGPRAGLDTEVRGKILCSCRRSNPDRPVVQSVVRHYTAWATPAPAQMTGRQLKTQTYWSYSSRHMHIVTYGIEWEGLINYELERIRKNRLWSNQRQEFA